MEIGLGVIDAICFAFDRKIIVQLSLNKDFPPKKKKTKKKTKTNKQTKKQQQTNPVTHRVMKELNSKAGCCKLCTLLSSYCAGQNTLKLREMESASLTGYPVICHVTYTNARIKRLRDCFE